MASGQLRYALAVPSRGGPPGPPEVALIFDGLRPASLRARGASPGGRLPGPPRGRPNFADLPSASPWLAVPSRGMPPDPPNFAGGGPPVGGAPVVVGDHLWEHRRGQFRNFTRVLANHGDSGR